MSSARKRSFRPELSGLQLEGRQLLTAGGMVAGKAAVLVGPPIHHPIIPIPGLPTPEAVTAKTGRVVSHPRPRIPMGEPHREPLGGGNPMAGPVGLGKRRGGWWLE